jgi:hypothetical protein
MRRISRPDEIARWILHIVTDFDYTTGQVFMLDGGASGL